MSKWYYCKAGTFLFYYGKTQLRLLRKVTKHCIASEKIPFTGLHLQLFIVSMYFILVFLENSRSIDTAFDTNPSSNSQSRGSKHRANNATCTHDRWLKKFRNGSKHGPKWGSQQGQWSCLPFGVLPTSPARAGVRQASQVGQALHSPTAAQSCKFVSCLPRPHPAWLAGTPVSGAVSGRDCWGSICC